MNDTPIGIYIIIFIVLAIAGFGIASCENKLADDELAKVSPTAKTEYQEYNTESWGQKLVGGSSMKKTVYATYTRIAKDNHTTVYNAVKQTRGTFAGQFKQKFKSLNAFLSLPNVRNVSRIEVDGKPAVIVHYTWEDCSSDSDGHSHCYTEHDEVTIPEINQPNVDWETVE